MLLNNSYIPFYINPEKKVYNCATDFTQFEIGNNGLTSVISLVNTEGNSIIPFIDLSKYDSETKDWFWYDNNNFPLRLSYYNGEEWNLNYIWNFVQNYNRTYSFNPKVLSNGGESGFYSTSYYYIEDAIYYKDVFIGSPIIMTINEEIVYDKTIYSSNDVDPNLTILNSTNNKEFYYNPDTNKVYTNQNLTGSDPAQIKLYFKTLPNNVSVKCRMMGNYGDNSYLTPTVDYYLIKLNGQYLKG